MSIPAANLAFNAWLETLNPHAGERSRALGRPLVTLSYAQSLDGSLAAERGTPLEISSQDTMRMTHQLRAAHPALLVGIGTVLADDPLLTVRLAPGPNPQPVILDSLLRFPLTARLLSRPGSGPWIICAPDASAERMTGLQERGARVICVKRAETGGLDLRGVLIALHGLGVNLLMVEGGARVITSFLQVRLVDQAVITISPMWVGGLSAVEAPLSDGRTFPRFANARYGQFGPDLVVWGAVSLEGKPAG